MNVSSAAALRRAGVATIDDLAELNLKATRQRQYGRTQGLQKAWSSSSPWLGHGGRHCLLSTRGASPTGPDRPRRRRLPGAANSRISGPSQLPPHEQDGERLIRVYLSVDYDYTENRIGALSAHVTASRGQINTGWVDTGRSGRTVDPSGARPGRTRDCIARTGARISTA